MQMDLETLQPDLRLLMEHFAYRHEFLPISVTSGRLQLAHEHGRQISQSTLTGLRKRYSAVECHVVSKDTYRRVLWYYFGDHRPSQETHPSASGVTFQVAEVTPAAEPRAQTTLWQSCRERFVELRGVSQFYTPVLDEIDPHCNQLLAASHLAFAEHRPLILSPDMIWLTLLQGLCEHVEGHAEELRPLLVRSATRERLVVSAPGMIIESLESPWEEIFRGFHQLIGQQLQPEAASLATVCFSTTGPLEQAVFSIALMDTMKVYFDYHLNCVCGIPEITLEGTPSDWSQMRQALVSWRRFGLDCWLQAVDPILAQFEAAASGQVDRTFWNDLFQQHDCDDGGYGGPTCLFSGWIGRLFPYYGDQPNPALQERQQLFVSGFRSSLSRASVSVQAEDGAGNLEFVAGMLGIEQRGLALRPCLGWVVHQQRGFIEDDDLRKISRLRPELRSRAPKPEPQPDLLPPTPEEGLNVRVGLQLVELLLPDGGAPLLASVSKVREQLNQELGILLPGVPFRDHRRLEPDAYEICFGQTVLAQSRLISVPLFADHLLEVCRAQADQIFDLGSWVSLQGQHRTTHLELHRTLRRRGIRLERTWRLLRELLKQQIPIHDLVTILQTVLARSGQSQAEWVEACRAQLQQPAHLDPRGSG